MVCVKAKRSIFKHIVVYNLLQEIFGLVITMFNQRTKYRNKACRLFIALRVFVPIASNTHHTFSSYNVDSNDDGR